MGEGNFSPHVKDGSVPSFKIIILLFFMLISKTLYRDKSLVLFPPLFYFEV